MKEYVIEVSRGIAKDLEDRIWMAQRLSRPRVPRTEMLMEFLVAGVQGFKVEIFAKEHPPPHFRVAVGSSTANYTIEECSRISGNGEVLRYGNIVRDWWQENRHILVSTWNERRPSDCPVGRIGAPSPRKKTVKQDKKKPKQK
jgi:hypothetical protein